MEGLLTAAGEAAAVAVGVTLGSAVGMGGRVCVGVGTWLSLFTGGGGGGSTAAPVAAGEVAAVAGDTVAAGEADAVGTGFAAGAGAATGVGESTEVGPGAGAVAQTGWQVPFTIAS